MVQNGLWTMVWLLTTSWVYLHGLWSQLATTLGSIWDLASLTGAVDGLKLCLVAKKTWFHICAKQPSLPTIGPNQDSVPPGVKDPFYPMFAWYPGVTSIHGLGLG